MTTFEITVTCERCQESTTFSGRENTEAPKAWVEAHLDDGCPAPPPSTVRSWSAPRD